MAKHRVEYRPLAAWLAPLPLDAKCPEILAQMEMFTACDPDYWAGLLARMRELPTDADWFTTMERLCDLLQEQNPRFVRLIMLDWLLEEK